MPAGVSLRGPLGHNVAKQQSANCGSRNRRRARDERMMLRSALPCARWLIRQRFRAAHCAQACVVHRRAHAQEVSSHASRRAMLPIKTSVRPLRSIFRPRLRGIVALSLRDYHAEGNSGEAKRQQGFDNTGSMIFFGGMSGSNNLREHLQQSICNFDGAHASNSGCKT